MLQHSQTSFEHVRDGRRAVDEGARCHISVYPCLPPGFRTFADRHMTSHSCLAAEHDVILECRTPSNSNLGAQDAVFTNGDIVPDLHQVIDLGALADQRSAKSRTIDRTIGSDFNIVLQNYVSNLRDFLMTAPDEFVSKSVTSNHNARVKSHSIVQNTFGLDRTTRHHPAIISDLSVPTHEYLRLEMRSLTNSRPLFDYAKRSDRG